jgi:hypothetical protein
MTKIELITEYVDDAGGVVGSSIDTSSPVRREEDLLVYNPASSD